MAADRAIWCDRHCDHEAVRRLHDARVRRRADVSQPGPASARTARMLVLRRRRDPRAVLAHLCGVHGVLRRRRLRHALRAAAVAVVSAVQPAGAGRVDQALAFNTSVSFVTNTNWQSYVPETTMGYLVQMAGFTVHNFVSAAVGNALALALIRGFVRREASGIGNFWVDLTRCTLYILLPISLITGLFLVWQGVPQNLGAY